MIAGIKFCGNRRISHIFNLLWGLVYSICGATQFVAGIYFMLDLPIFQLGSNIWTGAWVRRKMIRWISGSMIRFWTYRLYVMLMSRFIFLEFIQWSIDHPVVQYWTAIKLESPRNPPSVFGSHSCKLSESGYTRSRRMEGISFSNG